MYLARTNISTVSQPERCAMHDSDCQTKVNRIFRHLIKRRSESAKEAHADGTIAWEWLGIHSTKNEMPMS
jgi:hypothetical protein